MPATFSRIHDFVAEVLTPAAINAEFDNILNNLDPSGLGDYSVNAAQMRLQTSPGDVGTESLATSTAGELERLRYVIRRILGSQATYWYQNPATTLSDLVSALGSGLPPNRISAGRTTGNSSQLAVLFPSGSTSSCTLSASSTPFTYYINGTAYSITASLTFTGLSLAPSANTTCLINAADIGFTVSGQQFTRMWGMFGTTIPVDTMGASVVAALSTIATFKSGNEYFMAYVNSTTQLTVAWRGCFFDSSGAAIKAVGFSDNDPVVLMKTAWIFATTAGSVAITYANPTISGIQPTSPNTGDYWFDLASTAWKTFNSSTWVTASATLIGATVQNTAACVAARTFDSYSVFDSLNNISLQTVSGTVLQSNSMFSQVSVFGKTNSFLESRPTWSSSSNLDAGITLSASTSYFMYMKENGVSVVSDVYPMLRKDLKGLYHPSETWRCLGASDTDTSTAFTVVRSFTGEPTAQMILANTNIYTSPGYTGLIGDVGLQLSDIYPSNYVAAATTGAITWPGLTTASNTYVGVETITLTPGLWAISAMLQIQVSQGTATGVSSWIMGVSTSSGNAFADISPHNYRTSAIPVMLTYTNPGTGVIVGTAYQVNGWGDVLELSNYLVRVNSPTKYILKGNIVNLPATASAVFAAQNWRMLAERIDRLDGVPR